MKHAIIEQKVLGMVSTNTWFLKNKETGALLIIDPADQPLLIQQKITAMEGKPEAILLTHGHFDHMMAADAVRSMYGIPVLADPAAILAMAQHNAAYYQAWLRPEQQVRQALRQLER